MFVYLHNFNRINYAKNTNPLDKFIILCHVFNIIKHSTIIMLDLSYSKRMLLFDYSLFTGGIQMYSVLAFISALIMEILIRKLFSFSTDIRLTYWTKLFDIICNRVHRKELDLNECHNSI